MLNPYFKWNMKPPRGTKLKTDHPLNMGLVGFWPFWEGAGQFAYDISGFNNKATLFNISIPGNGTLSGWTTGKYGPALCFDKTPANQYTLANPNSAIQLLGNMSCFITFFTTVTALQGLVNFSKNSIVYDSYGIDGQGTNIIRFIWNTTGGGAGTATLNIKQWYDVVVTRFGSAGSWDWKIYIDGTLDGSGNSVTDPSLFSVNTDNLGFGARASSVSQGSFSSVILSDVRLWNRALTVEEVKALSNSRFQVFESPSYRKYFFDGAASQSVVFRKTFSPIGSHTGGRETQNA